MMATTILLRLPQAKSTTRRTSTHYRHCSTHHRQEPGSRKGRTSRVGASSYLWLWRSGTTGPRGPRGECGSRRDGYLSLPAPPPRRTSTTKGAVLLMTKRMTTTNSARGRKYWSGKPIRTRPCDSFVGSTAVNRNRRRGNSISAQERLTEGRENKHYYNVDHRRPILFVGESVSLKKPTTTLWISTRRKSRQHRPLHRQ